MRRLVILTSITSFIIIGIIYIDSLPNNRYAYEVVKTPKILVEKIKSGLPDNVYVHATNSPQRALEYSKFYSNFELDIYINQKENILDIMHWPSDSSINFHLEKLIEITKESSDPHYWLDIKNLNINNLDTLNMHINKILVKNKNIKKDNFLIESSNYIALGMMKEMGYKTSAWIRLPRGECLKGDKLIELTELLHNNSDYYSFPLSVANKIEQCLTSIIDQKPTLTWSNDGFNSINFNNEEEYKMFVIDHFYERSIFDDLIEKIRFYPSKIIFNLDSHYAKK